ncbi:MAG: TldD/PmbA family protein [candidate division Zixibacteria bacterium]|nr:TldD/PmbA family protein [candidate division Zixibacteria bacterium]
MLSKEKALEILEKGLKYSDADQIELLLLEEDFYLTRFAENVIHQNMGRADHTVMARAVLGKKLGVAVTNKIDEDGIKKVVKDATEIAKNQKDDPDFVSLPQSNTATQVKGFYSDTHNFSPDDRAKNVKVAVDKSKKNDLISAGAFQTETDVTAVVNSSGIRQYFQETKTNFSLTVSKDEQSGWAQGFSREVKDINTDKLSQIAVEKALLSVNQVELPPGEYTVILEEAAVASFLLFLAFLGFGGKTFSEGRSFMKIGEKITGDNITIIEDPYDPVMNGMPFDYEGVTKKKVVLIENGVGKGVVYNSYYANKNKTESTGHALQPNNIFGPYPKNMIISPGNSTLDEMIASTDKGILITHFWYINYMNPMKTQVTGTTRDGTFLIENGKIKSAVKNMRIGQSILEAFSNVELMTKERKLCPQYGVLMYVPAMKINKFNFIGG